ncbi:Neutral/alkaline non-lysosomal ceramidase-domain-containing protein [Mycena olivaceomarginata]|nr:Neutral/alkaline non-lysosomal ceramidase-domain-containing protein [Mycena olivaceomarginata]
MNRGRYTVRALIAYSRHDALSNQFLYALLATTNLFSGSTPAPSRLSATGEYLLGLGIADITGPQRGRVFVVAEPNSSERTLLLNADISMGYSGVRRGLRLAVAEEYGNTTYHGCNVALAGTHEHSGVGGYLKYLIPQVTSKGLHPQSLAAIVDGALLAVRGARNSLLPGTLSFGMGRVESGSRNRSPTAYLANLADERTRYAKIGGDGTGRVYGETTHVAGFVQGAVDDTSPNTSVSFILPHSFSFVALAHSGNSPASRTTASGLPCVANPSKCGGRVQECHGRGPAFAEDTYGFASSAEIGARQARTAGANVRSGDGEGMTAVRGSVRSVHAYVDMTRYEFALRNRTRVRTCPAAMRFSFVGGTTCGLQLGSVHFPQVVSVMAPAHSNLCKGDNKTSQSALLLPFQYLFLSFTFTRRNPFWELVKVFITPSPSEEQVACQYPKPILLNTWSPSAVDLQIFRAANFVMPIITGELMTRRAGGFSKQLLDDLGSILGDDAHVVVAGTANTYRTISRHGSSLPCSDMRAPRRSTGHIRWRCIRGGRLPLIPHPRNISKAISMQTDVKFDAAPLEKHFGQTLQDVRIAAPYRPGETVFARFYNRAQNTQSPITAPAAYVTPSAFWLEPGGFLYPEYNLLLPETVIFQA